MIDLVLSACIKESESNALLLAADILEEEMERYRWEINSGNVDEEDIDKREMQLLYLRKIVEQLRGVIYGNRMAEREHPKNDN